MTNKHPSSSIELAKLQQAIAAQEALRGILPDDQLEATLAALRQQVAQLSGTGALAQGDQARAASATEGGLAIAGDVHGNVYTGRPPADEAEALAIYRRVLVQSSGQLPLRGIDPRASDPAAGQAALSLAQVYVDLDTTTSQVKAGQQRGKTELLTRAMDALFKPKGQDGSPPAAMDWEEPRALTALEAAIGYRRLVLLGDPGGGKSTFVNHLAHCLAAQTLEQLPGWPAEESEIVPLPVILRDFAHGLPEPLPAQAEPRHLWDFITGRLAAQNLEFAVEPLRRALEQGRAHVLLDGLDEVISVRQRAFVRDAVYTFMNRYQRNRYLITCRTLAYQPPAEPGAPDLRLPPAVASFELAPFDAVRIDRFISAWYGELARTGTIRPEDQAGLTEQLQQAVRRPDLWRLASNPLLLTVMALVHAHQGRLPEARALLYEETIDILLWRWEQVKSGGQRQLPRLRQLLQAAERTEVDLKRSLWALAYQAHTNRATTDASGLADIGELHLQKTLAALNDNDYNWARQMIETMKLRAGLLLERAPEVFTFPHRTFQEYLAGAHLGGQPDFARQATRLAENNPAWQEVILLAVGRLVYLTGDTAKPLSLVAELCPTGSRDIEKTHLAGAILLEIGLKRVGDSALGRELLERVHTQLMAFMGSRRVKPYARMRAGGMLGQLGDPRPEVMTVAAMEFCYIPPGPFWVGNPDGDEQIGDELHQVDLPHGYWLARYPVTVAQFEIFVEATEYTPRSTGYRSLSPNYAIQPITWADATAFCVWLTEIWQREKILVSDQQVRLPSEAEWEKAARGGLDIVAQPCITTSAQGFEPPRVSLIPNPMPTRKYAWGEEGDDLGVFTGAFALINVGCFPEKVGPYGNFEMGGNVFEWTRNPSSEVPSNPLARQQISNEEESYGARGGPLLIGLTDPNRVSDNPCTSRADPQSLKSLRQWIGFRPVISTLEEAEGEP